jgi:hypothetical protein
MMVQATKNTEKNAEFVTSVDKRAVSVPGAGLRQRNRNPVDYALTVFGRSTRESNCDCDRTEEPSLLQTIFVRNDSQLLALIDDSDGWLKEVASANQLTFARKSQPDAEESRRDQKAALKERYQSQISRLKERMAAAEKAGNEDQLKSLKKQLSKLKDQARKAGAETDDAEPVADASTGSSANISDSPASKLNVAAIIDEAYLRTLSRFPTAHEMQTAQTFIAESADPVDGIRSVLWALMNTREFIVNH